MLRAGMSRADITPPLGIELGGYPHYPRNNTGSHDPLYTACMYLDNGKCEVAMVTVDTLLVDKIYNDEIKERASRATGIPIENIMISASHTHSAPWACGRLDLDDINEKYEPPMEYVRNLIEKTVYVITDAKKYAFSASFAKGVAICGPESDVGGNRRVRGGPHDPLVSVMAVKDEYGEVRGVIVNYSLHPTFIHEWSTVCTADYPCYLKLEVAREYPKALVGFAQGTPGNQSSRYYRHGESFDEAERVGRTLGRAALSVIKDAIWKKDIELDTRSSVIDIDLREYESDEVLLANIAHDRAVYNELYAKYGKSENRDEYYLWQNANLKMLGSENKYNAAQVIKGVGHLSVQKKADIQAFKIDDACVIALPGEPFVEYGLYLKACAGYDMVVINCCSNSGLPGYLYTPQALASGGYEIDTSMLHPKFGMKLVNQTLELVDTLD